MNQSTYALIACLLWGYLLFLQHPGINNTWILVIFEFYWRVSMAQTTKIKVMKEVLLLLFLK